MRNVNLISDLHLEFSDLVLPGGDILIISGDACEAKNLKPGTKYYRFFQEECAKYNKVIYVMGNHEHYGGYFDKSYNMLQSQVPKNVHVLENEFVEIDGIIFIGATLWTDCNKRDPITMHALRSSMNDYRVITKKDGENYRKLTPQDTVYTHAISRQFIFNTVKSFKDRPVVVVTHHAPSSLSVSECYKQDYHMNGGFVNNLEDVILDNENIKVWTHGHTHDGFDYHIGSTRVMCNPRGYYGYEEQAKNYDPTVGFIL